MTCPRGSPLLSSVVAQVHTGSSYRDTIRFALHPILVAILIPQFIAFRHTCVGWWLNWRWMRYLGLISYSIYLHQQLVIWPVRNRLPGVPLLIQLAVVIAAVVLPASASYYVIERPFLRIKKHFAAK